MSGSIRSLVAPLCPTVLLRHDLPAGGGVESHWDWMIARDPEAADAPDSRSLITFRLEERPDLAPPGSVLRARRLPNHRAAYLHYEGPISGDRGRVRCIRAGTIVRGAIKEADGGELHIVWENPRIEAALRLTPEHAGAWRVICLASEAALR